MKLKKLSTGVFLDKYGIRAIVNIAAGRKEKRFDRDAPLREVKRWRNEMRVKLERLHPQKKAGVIARGTFSADMRRYLKTLAIASWDSRRSELRAWEKRIGRLRRSRITRDHVEAAIKAWTDDGVQPKTILNRLRGLSAMYHALDGPDAWTPLIGIKKPKVRKRKPLYVPVDLIRRVEENLRAGDPKTHARYMVLTATGARPAHLKRADPADVDLERRYWNIPAAKDGEPIELWLNDDMLVAWQTFMRANAWGDFNAQHYAQELRAAGWPKEVRPYNAKHTFGQDLANLGFSRETIGDWYGHSPGSDMTAIYTGTTKLRRVSEAIDGRLGWGRTLPTDSAAESTDRAVVDVGSLTPDQRKRLMNQLLEEMLKTP